MYTLVESLQILKFLCVCGFYLVCNFVPIFLPVGVYHAWAGSFMARGFVALSILDYLVPLRLPGLSMRWCSLTEDTAGKKRYFDAELVVEAPFEKSKNYLICYHPHSLFGIAYNLFTHHLYHTYGTICLFTGADIILKIPLLRRMLAWWGCTSASAGAMRKNLQLPWPHNAVMLQPGGVAEMFYGTESEQIILDKRKGFCKIALQTGACIVPCYAFGANEVYTRYFGPTSLAARLSSVLRTSLVVWTGRWGVPFGPVPHLVKLLVVLGAPLEVGPPVAEPSPEQILALHARYVSALQALFEKYKARMGPEWVQVRGARLYLENEVVVSARAKRE